MKSALSFLQKRCYDGDKWLQGVIPPSVLLVTQSTETICLKRDKSRCWILSQVHVLSDVTPTLRDNTEFKIHTFHTKDEDVSRYSHKPLRWSRRASAATSPSTVYCRSVAVHCCRRLLVGQAAAVLLYRQNYATRQRLYVSCWDSNVLYQSLSWVISTQSTRHQLALHAFLVVTKSVAPETARQCHSAVLQFSKTTISCITCKDVVRTAQ